MDECLEKLNPRYEKPLILINFSNSNEGRQFENKNSNKSDLLVQKLLYYKPLMHLVDAVVSLAIIAPLIVTFWRSTWTLMDFYVRFLPYWPTFFFSSTLQVSAYLLKELGTDYFTNLQPRSELFKSLMLRFYTYGFALISIMYWRGIWGIHDYYLDAKYREFGTLIYDERTYLSFIVFGVSLAVLFCLKNVRNILAAPLVVVLDNESATFMFPTRFRVKVSDFAKICCFKKWKITC